MKPYRIVIAGCGSMAKTWARYALTRPDAEIVALVDINPEAICAFADELKLDCPHFDSVGAAIEQTRANLLFNITLPSAHFELTTTALKMGCDVLSEKPLAESMEQAREMIKTARECSRRLIIMQNRRFLHGIYAYRDTLRNGSIGTPALLSADFFIGAHFGGFRDLMDNVLLLDMAIHTFDQARYLLGDSPVSVYCHEYNPAYSWYQGNAGAVCVFEMKSGAVFTYNGCWCAEGVNTSWNAQWRAMGSRGTAMWDGEDGVYFEAPIPEEKAFIHKFQRTQVPVDKSALVAHEGCLAEMFEALRDGRCAETEAEDNLHSLAMVLGAIESARTGLKVRL